MPEWPTGHLLMGKWWVAIGQQETGNHFEASNCRGRRETRNLNRKRTEEPTVLVPGTAAQVCLLPCLAGNLGPMQSFQKGVS